MSVPTPNEFFPGDIVSHPYYSGLVYIASISNGTEVWCSTRLGGQSSFSAPRSLVKLIRRGAGFRWYFGLNQPTPVFDSIEQNFGFWTGMGSVEPEPNPFATDERRFIWSTADLSWGLQEGLVHCAEFYSDGEWTEDGFVPSELPAWLAYSITDPRASSAVAASTLSHLRQYAPV